jgi:hypothetical protein
VPSLRPDLAAVTVASAGSGSTTVDFVRSGRRWLMSFSHGQNPIPALAG